MTTIGRERMLALYRQMLLIRRCEEALVRLYAAGKIGGACHTYIGEEAVATGVCAHLRKDDAVFSTHRGHGHALAKGVPPAELIAELLGKATGCSGGRGGSMHLFKPEIGFMGSSGIVGPSITLAAGGAFSARLMKTDRVSVAFFGDGAVNNGSFHEGINLAAAWSLPALFVCENNLYATEVAFAQSARNPSVAARAAAYGLPGVEVDGNDVLAVYAVAGEAVDRARVRRRPHADRMQDLPHTRPLRGDARGRLPDRGGDRPVAGARSHQAVQGNDSDGRSHQPGRSRSARRRGESADRGGCGVRRKQPSPRPGHRRRSRLQRRRPARCAAGRGRFACVS